jgi:hypothetical protein
MFLWILIQIRRGATVRVPADATVAVEVARLAPENFDKWESFRNILLVRTVSLIQTLSKSERFHFSLLFLLKLCCLSLRRCSRSDFIRLKILQQIEVKEFKHDEYIVRQGEIGSD